MSADRWAMNGSGPGEAARLGGRSELEVLRATCRRQRSVIDMLGEAVGALRAGASALKAENAELRADNHRMRERREHHLGDSDVLDHPQLTELSLSPDVSAPATARGFVVRELSDHVGFPLLERAQLLASELTTNSVRHSGAPADAPLSFRVGVSTRMVRLEVQDPGRDGVIAPRPADRHGGGGFGLNIVQALSERWGLERVAGGGTRVWAQLSLDA